MIPTKHPQPSPSSYVDITIRKPGNNRKKYNLMRFRESLDVDFARWKNAKMEREKKLKEFESVDKDLPARRKKYPMSSKKYNPETQPWILNVGGKSEKKYKGMREGGVGENFDFYVFEKMPDGTIEAYLVNECYNYKSIQRYKTLSAEEAEREFGRKKKIINHFSVMLNKRLKGDEEEGEVKSKGPEKKTRKLKISDMDEWIDSDDDSDSDADEKSKKKEEDNDDDEKKKKTKKALPEHKRKRDLDNEAFEESDDGDEEGRELDYISDSSEDEPDPEGKVNNELKSVAEEDALRKLLTSDDEEDEEKNSVNEHKKKEQTRNKDKESKYSRDPEADNKKTQKNESSGSNSRSASSSISQVKANKRKAHSMSSDFTASQNSNGSVSALAKKPKLEIPSSPVTLASSFSDYGITEDAVRRFLMLKPVTPTELTMYFKNKTAGVSSDGLVQTITQILKKINPVKKTIDGTYLLQHKKKEQTRNTNKESKYSRDSEAENNKTQKNEASGSNSRSASSSISQVKANKRKAHSMSSDFTASQNSNGPVSTLVKKPKLEIPSPPVSLASSFRDYGITEDAVRRFLMLKPVTPTELTMYFKNKTAGVSTGKQ